MRGVVLLVTLLAGCRDCYNPNEVGGSASGEFKIAAGGMESGTFVAHWRSTRGRQTVSATALAPAATRPFRVHFALTLPNGKTLQAEDHEGGDIPLEGPVTCAKGSCDMVATGVVTYRDPAEAVDASTATISPTKWAALVVVNPDESRVGLSDLVIEVHEQDGGTE